MTQVLICSTEKLKPNWNRCEYPMEFWRLGVNLLDFLRFWLVGWLAGWWAGWLAGWQSGWLAACLSACQPA